MIGKTILHYKILSKLGEGGMGVVYRAEDAKLKREVAIKFLPRQIAASDEERERFKIEAQAAAALNHANIATIYAIEEPDDETFIAMEYIKGKELKDKIDHGPLSIDDTLNIAIQIAKGLQAAHEEGIVHRDIKSANIMLTHKGDVKIMDFGLAKVRGGPKLTKEQSTLGTAPYMSPEQTRGEEVNHRTDIFSLGVLIYEMLTGKLPFKGDYEQAVIYAIINEEPQPVAELRPDVPAGLADVIHQALSKDPAERFATAGELIAALEAFEKPSDTAAPSFAALMRKPGFMIAAAVLVVCLAALGWWWINRSAKVAWARQEALPQIEQMLEDISGLGEGKEVWAAFELGAEVEGLIPDDPLHKRLQPRYSNTVNIYSDPPGALLSAQPYINEDQDWRILAQAPLEGVRLPIGLSIVKLELAGFQTLYDVVWNTSLFIDTLRYTMSAEGSLPKNMVLLPKSANWNEIEAAPAALHLPGLEHLKAQPVGDYLMDVYEVSNLEYKRFVDGGGYENRDYWKHAFVKDGRTLVWNEAMALLVDRTGRRGPATWEVGDYPDGKEDLPVRGISWYEAAAYAEYVGKSLPTVYHWDRAALTWASSTIVPQSNLSGEGPRPVNSKRSMNRFGTFDLAGNVREWCFNQSDRGDRFILGGGWNDLPYAFNDAFAQPAFDRSETNGFRCIKYVGSADNRVHLEANIPLPFRDFMTEKPVSDQTFVLIRNQYAYDKTDLEAVVESVSEAEDWTREKISFNAAYGGERMAAYLFLPKRGRPPYQTVIYFPGSGAIHSRSSEGRRGNTWLAKSGRAFLYPIYKSTYERGDDLKSDYPDETIFWKDHVIMWAKDFSRSIDYLETRNDIDTDRLAYYGVSWGGGMGGIIPAVERRIKTVLLVVAGLQFQRSLPEAETINFLPRITVPVIMMNGKYDFFFPYETAQRPFFELLGTPAEDKKLFLYERGHTVPRNERTKEILAWLDKYLGEVVF